MALEEKLSDYFERFCAYMQQDTKGVEIGVYTVSGLLFAVAYARVRPITKFGKPSDIPKRFIRNKARQYGSIAGVDPSAPGGPVLLIDHRPPLNALIPRGKLLPVKLTGISVNANGYSWLQTVAVDHDVEFIPLSRSGTSAECQVLMLCPHNQRQRLDLSEALLSLGFGKIENIQKHLQDDPIVKRYYKYLQNIEKNAKDQRLGLWALTLPPVSWPLRTLRNMYKSALLRVLPANRRLPELVR